MSLECSMVARHENAMRAVVEITSPLPQAAVLERLTTFAAKPSLSSLWLRVRVRLHGEPRVWCHLRGVARGRPRRAARSGFQIPAIDRVGSSSLTLPVARNSFGHRERHLARS